VPYPFSSSNALTISSLTKAKCLRRSPCRSLMIATDPEFRVWYNDEHALTAGHPECNRQATSGFVTNSYPITTMRSPSQPDGAVDPLVGSTVPGGDQGGTDLAGRPIFPALFITGPHGNPNNSLAGDWHLAARPIRRMRYSARGKGPCGRWTRPKFRRLLRSHRIGSSKRRLEH